MPEVTTPLERYLRVSVRYRLIFFRITNDINAAVMLSQAWFWHTNSKDPNGEFWKTRSQWERETGLTRRQQEAARKILVEEGFMHEPKVERGQPKRFIVMVTAILQAIEDYTINRSHVCDHDFPAENGQNTKVSIFKARQARYKAAGK